MSEESPVKDSKELAQQALTGFPDETMLFRDVPDHPELLEQLASLDGVSIDPEKMQAKARMFGKIYTTLHGMAGNGIAVGSSLEGAEKGEAVQFLQGEISRYQSMIDALQG